MRISHQRNERIESEFGKGLCYCLGLFLAHAEKWREIEKVYEKIGSHDWPEMWFNDAAAHLYELQIPATLPALLQARLAKLKTKGLHWRLSMNGGSATKANVIWAIDEAKELLRLIDEHIGVETIEASWK